MSESLSSKPSSSRVVELDALRAFAAINLMLFHFTHVYQVKYGFSTPLGFEFPFGKYGVQLFFMLSGLVNAMTLGKKRSASDFMASRLIRILPSFYLMVGLNLFLLTLMPMSQVSGYSAAQVAANLTVMPGLFGFDCLEPVTWTLQVELLFYGILVFFLLSGALERPFRPLMGYLLLCLVGGQVLLHMSPDAKQQPSGWLTIMMGNVLLFKYMPLFSIGIFINQLKNCNSTRISSWIGIFMSAVVFHLVDDHGHNPIATVLLISLLWLAAHGRIPVLRTKVFVFLSGISYSFYLFHNNLGCVVIYRLDTWGVPPLICFVAAILLMILVAAAVTNWFERPLTKRLLSRWKSWHAKVQLSLTKSAAGIRPAAQE